MAWFRNLLPFGLHRRGRVAALERENRMLRQENMRLQQQLHMERSYSESTQTMIEKETFNVVSHLDRIIEGLHDGEDIAELKKHTVDILESYAQFVIRKDRVRILVGEGDLSKRIFSIDEPLQGPLKRVIIFTQYLSSEEAELQTLVSYPPGGPKRPFGLAIGRFYIEEEVRGCNSFELLYELQQRSQPRSAAIAYALRKKLLTDQAYFQAHPPLVPSHLHVPAETGRKLSQAFAGFHHGGKKLEGILRDIGEYLDSYGCVPYRDLWLFNPRHDLSSAARKLALPPEAGADASLFADAIMACALPLSAVAQAIDDATYERDFDRIRYFATESRDRLHVLHAAVNPPTAEEIESLEQHYRAAFEGFGGNALPREDVHIALFNNSVRSAHVLAETRPHPAWEACMLKHLQNAALSLKGCDASVISFHDRDYLIRTIDSRIG